MPSLEASGRRQVVAMGGGGFSMEPDNPLLDQYVLSLARSRPTRVCFLPTASGDSDRYVADFYQSLVAAGRLAAGWAADDGAGLVFAGEELVEVVTSREGAGGYRVEPDGDGGMTETRLPARYLGT